MQENPHRSIFQAAQDTGGGCGRESWRPVQSRAALLGGEGENWLLREGKRVRALDGVARCEQLGLVQLCIAGNLGDSVASNIHPIVVELKMVTEKGPR